VDPCTLPRLPTNLSLPLPDPRSPRAPSAPLPPPPRIALEVLRDRTSTASLTGGFLDLLRLDLVARYPGGETSAPFAYDMVTRKALDAAVIAAHFTRGGARHVFLRTALRPPLAMRASRSVPGVDPRGPASPGMDPGVWELPAGLIEPGEAPVAAAARELEEELGFRVPASALQPMGGWTLPAPGMVAEVQYFFHVEVDPDAARGAPTEDGSALERGASILSLPVTDALEHCRRGLIPDAKTELGLRRLLELA